MLKIVTVPNVILTAPTQKVKTITPRIKRLVEEMKKTLVAQRDPEGVGLAAPQVGESLSIFIMRPTLKGEISVCINPSIVHTGLSSKALAPEEFGSTIKTKKKKHSKMEGCLSIPRIWAPLKRKPTIHLEYEDLDGNKHTKEFEGFEAIIVAHEVDHLNGILFTQRCLEQKVTLYEEDGDELIAMKA